MALRDLCTALREPSLCILFSRRPWPKIPTILISNFAFLPYSFPTQRIIVTDLTLKLCRQHSVFEKDGFTFTDLISKVLISDMGSEKKATTVIFSDLSLLTILIRCSESYHYCHFYCSCSCSFCYRISCFCAFLPLYIFLLWVLL